MSKIICDVCGTSYPETATQCPICGCVRPSDVVIVNSDTSEADAQRTGTYTYVKGGRFSKANVKKRNRNVQNISAEPAMKTTESEPDQQKRKTDKGLIIAVCALLLAIVAVVIYIALHFFAPGILNTNDSTTNTTTDTAVSTEESTLETTSEPTVLEIPCVDIVVSKTVVEFEKAGAAYLLNVTSNPGNTTDVVTFISSDETVATVTNDGKIEAVGPGQAVIAISCGAAKAECRVECNFEGTDTTEQTVAPTEDSAASTGSASGSYKLNTEDRKNDVTIAVGESFDLRLLDANGKSISVTWTIADSTICKIEGSTVTGTKVGRTTVSATYEGEIYSCIVRVKA